MGGIRRGFGVTWLEEEQEGEGRKTAMIGEEPQAHGQEKQQIFGAHRWGGCQASSEESRLGVIPQ